MPHSEWPVHTVRARGSGQGWISGDQHRAASIPAVTHDKAGILDGACLAEVSDNDANAFWERADDSAGILDAGRICQKETAR
jgi:hypothetical protein